MCRYARLISIHKSVQDFNVSIGVQLGLLEGEAMLKDVTISFGCEAMHDADNFGIY
jgi:hypothetical protein